MKRYRFGGFTLLELMAVVAIITILAGLLFAAGAKAREIAKARRSEAILDILATACERYWTLYHDWPYPDPDFTGMGTNTLGANVAFRNKYYSGGWTIEGRDVALVYVLSMPRQPQPFIALQQKWFQKIDENILGPDGRPLYKAVDGFDEPIKVTWGSRQYYVNSDIRLTSSGADKEYGADANDLKAKDNLERYLKR